MKSWVAALALAFLTGCGPAPPGLGSPCPDFVLDDLSGKRFYLNAQRGRAVLLNFWSVHCVPCQKEMPALQSLWARYRDRGLAMAGICTDPAEGGYLGKLVSGLQVDYPILSDAGDRVAAEYGVKSVPQTFILDKQGNLAYHKTGYSPGDEKKYEEVVQDLLDSRPAGPAGQAGAR